MSATVELLTSYIESQVSTGTLTIGEARQRAEALIAAHDREVVASVLRDIVHQAGDDYMDLRGLTAWLRERVDAIEGEK